MTLRQSLGAVLCAATASAACGSSDWELDVAVRIPIAVQSAYAGGYPAQLVLVSDNASPSDPESTGGTAQRVANLCSASDELVTINVKLTGSECAPCYLRAWL